MTVRDCSGESILTVERWCGEDRALMLANLSGVERPADVTLAAGRWHKAVDSSAPRWRGAGSALSDEIEGGKDHRFVIAPSTIALYHREHAG